MLNKVESGLKGVNEHISSLAAGNCLGGNLKLESLRFGCLGLALCKSLLDEKAAAP